jgi:SAM-dependent methyltransferase
MRRDLLTVLADPVTGAPLELSAEAGDADDMLEGTLHGSRAWPVVRGIPRFVETADEGQAETAATFGYKWERQDSYGSAGMFETLQAWMTERYGFATAAELAGVFAGRGWVLDVGCGSGLNATYWLDDADPEPRWVGTDISSAIDVARERLGGRRNTYFVQADVAALPFRPGSFDVVVAEGVLHHTPSTERSFKALAPLLAPGGEILAYVYRRKAPVREFTDDYVREEIAKLSPEEAWEALRPLTALGRALAETKTEVVVPEDVPLLGIKAGTYDVQRLVYWHFAKLYWNDALTFEEAHHINFDWYHPRYAHRHTRDELERWCAETGLDVVRLYEEESGFTLRARRA